MRCAPVSTSVERSRHTCDRDGWPAEYTHESDGESYTAIFPTCSHCGALHVAERLEWSTVVREIVENLACFVVPLYEDVRGVPSLIGSGFLVQKNEQVFLVSAAHVLDKALETKKMYFYVAPTTKRYLSGQLKRTAFNHSRQNDRLDVGVLRLDPPLPPYMGVRKFAMDYSHLRPSHLPRRGREYLVVGFPASRHKMQTAPAAVIAEPYGHRSWPIEDQLYERFGANPSEHIVFPFRRTKLVDLSGNRIHGPNPQGLSGGPVFVLREEEDEHGAFPVVGVLIEFTRSTDAVLIATDAALAAEAIDLLLAETRD
jgi:hypothetical protein